MINASTGNINSFLGIPLISKDINRFVVASLDLEAGYLPNRISIFRLIDNKIKKRKAFVRNRKILQTPGNIYAQMSWINSSR